MKQICISSVLIDIYCSCHNLRYFPAVYLYCFIIRYCFYHSLVNKDFQKCNYRNRQGRRQKKSFGGGLWVGPLRPKGPEIEAEGR